MPRTLRARFWTLLALLLVTVVLAHDAGAASTECEALDRHGLPRDCTFTEEFGQCAWNAYDSYWQCIRSAEEAHGRDTIDFALAATGCELGYYMDLAVCGLASPLKMLLK
jgi:hypothetical protein